MPQPLTAEEIAERASEAFFAEVFKHMPEGTTGDFPPDATMAWEQATRQAVRTIQLNVPPQKYFIVHEVSWSGDGATDEPPLDVTHELVCSDERVTGVAVVTLGELPDVVRALQDYGV